MMLYKGDLRAVTDYLPAVRRWLNWLDTLAQKLGVAHMYVVYGDWVPPPGQPKEIGPFCSMFSFLNSLHQYKEMARFINNE
jgi:hypothetical protein